ncbi:beta-lactamase [Aureimonas endophytica]|uniref:Beta-lactamase n=1 Tax=Aureimonas endophytica TaxID=2027858 RepID=A0A917E704_9HYPH|nr:class A beta-lactamase [Aureimonas endophytica]GGE06863.1 beta-lactamase [Aureimonas endophytica]
MRSSLSRRAVLAGTFSLVVLPAAAAPMRRDDLAKSLEALEKTAGGRLGVAVLGSGGGEAVGWRLDERFPMCSTFKTLAAAAFLRGVDAGRWRLDERAVYGKDQLVEYSPVTEKHVGAPGLAYAEIAEAAIMLSDNTAGNLLIDRLGGPAAITDFARSLGDGATRLDRREPQLNEGKPGDPRDTTTPKAMVEGLRQLLFGDSLSEGSKQQLTAWLMASRTSATRLRAGLPHRWTSGSKTGTSDTAGIANDAGLFAPPNGEPLIVAAYLAEAHYPVERRNEVLAEVGHLIAAA